MKELFEVAFTGANIVPTFLLIFVILYWIAVILGALDMGFLDFDIESDFETDVMIDFDVATSEAEVSNTGGWFQDFLSFFNLGKVPFMVFFSFLVMPMWVIAMGVTDFIAPPVWLGLLLLIPSFIVCMFIAKWCTWPLIRVFRALDEEGLSNQDLVGRMCIAKTIVAHEEYGQIEVHWDATVYSLLAKTSEGKMLNKGDSGLVVQYLKEKDTYVVEPYEHKV